MQAARRVALPTTTSWWRNRRAPASEGSLEPPHARQAHLWTTLQSALKTITGNDHVADRRVVFAADTAAPAAGDSCAIVTLQCSAAQPTMKCADAGASGQLYAWSGKKWLAAQIDQGSGKPDDLCKAKISGAAWFAGGDGKGTVHPAMIISDATSNGDTPSQVTCNANDQGSAALASQSYQTLIISYAHVGSLTVGRKDCDLNGAPTSPAVCLPLLPEDAPRPMASMALLDDAARRLGEAKTAVGTIQDGKNITTAIDSAADRVGKASREIELALEQIDKAIQVLAQTYSTLSDREDPVDRDAIRSAEKSLARARSDLSTMQTAERVPSNSDVPRAGSIDTNARLRVIVIAPFGFPSKVAGDGSPTLSGPTIQAANGTLSGTNFATEYVHPFLSNKPSSTCQVDEWQLAPRKAGGFKVSSNLVTAKGDYTQSAHTVELMVDPKVIGAVRAGVAFTFPTTPIRSYSVRSNTAGGTAIYQDGVNYVDVEVLAGYTMFLGTQRASRISEPHAGLFAGLGLIAVSPSTGNVNGLTSAYVGLEGSLSGLGVALLAGGKRESELAAGYSTNGPASHVAAGTAPTTQRISPAFGLLFNFTADVFKINAPSVP